MSTERKFVFAKDHVYHVFNRGYEKREIFTELREYKRAIATLNYYQFEQPPLKFSKLLEVQAQQREEILSSLGSRDKRIIDIISYCLMPNHFHLLLKLNAEHGIADFLSKFTNSYTKYFNTRHERTSNLFQGVFKAVPVESDEQLLHLSRYIHLNPVVSSIVSKPEDYPWSSYKDYIEGTSTTLVKPAVILDQFKSKGQYISFTEDHIDYAKALEENKHLSLD